MKIVKRLSIKRHAFKGYSQSVDAVLNESAPHLRAVAPRDPRRIIVAARGRHCYFSLLRAMHTCSEQGASTKGGTALHFATCTGYAEPREQGWAPRRNRGSRVWSRIRRLPVSTHAWGASIKRTVHHAESRKVQRCTPQTRAERERTRDDQARRQSSATRTRSLPAALPPDPPAHGHACVS